MRQIKQIKTEFSGTLELFKKKKRKSKSRTRRNGNAQPFEAKRTLDL